MRDNGAALEASLSRKENILIPHMIFSPYVLSLSNKNYNFVLVYF